MKQGPLISVLLPFFNEEKYLAKAINSVLEQTYKNIELFLFNDGSKDLSGNIALSFIDKRIKYYESENKGYLYHLNYGLSIAKGEYIARMDADDISHPDRFMRQIEFLESNPEISAVGTSFYRIDKKDKIVSSKKAPITYEQCKFIAPINSPILHPTLLIRKSVLLSVGGYNQKFYLIEDYELFNRLIDRGFLIANIDEYLFYYRFYKHLISSERELYQQNAIYSYGKNYLEGKLRTNNSTVYIQLAYLEYYLGDVNVSKKYFFKAFMKKQISFLRLLRFIPIITIGNTLTKILRKQKILTNISYFINRKVKLDLNKIEK